MNLFPYALSLAGLMFMLAGILRVLDRGSKATGEIARGRRKSHFLMIVVGFALVWAGMFLIVHGLHGSNIY